MRPKGAAAELEQRRRQAIALLQEGKTQAAAARALGTSEASVSRWREAYEHDGETANYIPDDLLNLKLELDWSIDQTRKRPKLLRSFLRAAELNL